MALALGVRGQARRDPLLDKTCWVWDVRSKPDQAWSESTVPAFFSWQDETRVFFLGRAGHGYETNWGVFKQFHDRFLESTWDDGILFHPTEREVAIFFEGWVWFGRRSKRRLIDKDQRQSTKRPLE